MALNNDTLLTAAKGYIFTDVVGNATAPTPQDIYNFVDGSSLSGTWTNLGHTAREELPEFGFEGGDTETLGTWQVETVKEIVTTPAVDYVTFNAHQMEPEIFELYYGSANTSTTEGVYSVRSLNDSTQERALLIVIVDGDSKVAFYAPRTSIRREEAMTMAVDSFTSLPLRATFLQPEGDEDLFQWITGLDSSSS